MEAIVTLKLIKDIANKEKNLMLTDKKAQEILDNMEVELKEILFNSPLQINLAKKTSNSNYTQWIVDDPVYPNAVATYIKGKIPDENIKILPEIISNLLIKHINRT